MMNWRIPYAATPSMVKVQAAVLRSAAFAPGNLRLYIEEPNPILEISECIKREEQLLRSPSHVW
jgi:hypothetical protein